MFDSKKASEAVSQPKVRHPPLKDLCLQSIVEVESPSLLDNMPEFKTRTETLQIAQATTGFVPYSDRIRDYFARWPGANVKARLNLIIVHSSHHTPLH